ncbi:MAG TPA: tetratricopeptide repeat protein [Chthoniobacterales bacterium]|nr:tetratricopeptide repeat protein [Chthoniobacterales bacterium]
MRRRPAISKTAPRWNDIAICGVLVLLAWVVFGQTLAHDFVNYDDKTYVYGNSLVSNGLTLRGIVRAFADTQTGNWHPLTLISHMLDCQFFGLKPGGHHFTNVLFHAMAVLLLFLWLRKATGKLWPSAFVAAMFAIHPLRVESVAWIAERKDVLSAVFFMLTLGAYVHYVRKPALGRYLTMSILFAAGLMSKPMLVTVPFVLLLLDYWPLGRSKRSEVSLLRAKAATAAARGQKAGSKIQIWLGLLAEKIPLFVLSIGSCVVTFILQERSTGSIAQLPFSWRVQNAIVSYVTYLWQMFWPAKLAVFYPHPENHLALWQVVFAAAFLVAITLLVFALRRARPYLLVGWLWYLSMLLPVIGFVEVGLQGHADRYTYLPQIGLYIAITWLVADLSVSLRFHRKILAAAAIIIVTALTARAWKQTSYWRNSETLWTHTLAVTQDNDVAHTNLGMFLADRGQLDEALAHLQTALQIRSGGVQPHYDLSFALIHCDLGYALAKKGELDNAIAHLRKAIEFQPNYPDAHYNLGTALFQKGRIDEAIAEWQKTLSIRPNDSGAHTSLGNALVQKGSLRDAIDHYQTALDLAPNSILPLNNLAWVRATCPDTSLRDGAKAVELAQQADQLSDGKNPVFTRTLAAAYAENGRFNDAIETAQRAAQLATAQGEPALANQIEQDVDLYRKHAPLRDLSLTNARPNL